MTLIQGRSSFGAFVRSPFGARGVSGNNITAEFDAVAGMKVYIQSIIRCSGYGFMLRDDSPYGTQVGVGTIKTGAFDSQYMGKTRKGTGFGPPPVVRRIRGGFNCFVGSTGTTSSPVSAKLYCQIGNFRSPHESWNSQLYVSNTDDHTLSGSWYNNLDNNCGTSLGSSDGNPGVAVFDLPVAKFAYNPSGAYVSFILGTDVEFSGSGSGTNVPLAGDPDGFTLSADVPYQPFVFYVVLTY